MSKKLHIIIIVILLLSTVIHAQTVAETDRPMVKFSFTESETKPILNKHTGHTLLPLRYLAESLGYEILWNSDTKSVTMKRDIYTFELFPCSEEKTIYMSHSYHDYPVEYTGSLSEVYFMCITNGRTYVSLSFVADVLNCNISWDSTKKTIEVTERLSFSFVSAKYKLINSYDILSKKEETKAMIYENMEKADESEKTSRVIVNFYDDYNKQIFMNNLETYFENCSLIREQPITGSVLIEFNTIEEAESAVYVLNEWASINYAHLDYVLDVIPA